MECNSRGPSERTHTSSQSSSSIPTSSTDNADLQYTLNNADLEMQDDVVVHESVGQSSSYKIGLQTGDVGKDGAEEVTKHGSCSTSTAHSKHLHQFSTTRRPSMSNNFLLRLPSCMTRHGSEGLKVANLLKDKAINPPVTISTLQELDLHSIQNNLNLRIDVCHDPELFFQPISGRKGDEKRLEAKKYWTALTAEFQVYLHNSQPSCAECDRLPHKVESTFEPSLPAFFDNLREIVHMLVPEFDHEEVADHLDTELLMQQVRKGALDSIKLATWLAKLLTSHCAPMRDPAAMAVTEQVRLGTENGDMAVFVDGLEKLLSLLEAMKLDIANHQIRSFRYPLIEGTVEFQQDCFSKAIDTQQIDITDSQHWYRRHCTAEHRFECGFQHENEATQRFECFVHGLVHLCSPYERDVPLTLQYDHNRIMRLQEDLQDHIQMSLCLAVFNKQAQEIAGPHCDPSVMHNDLKDRIIRLTEDDNGNGGAIGDHLDAIGVEITRAAFSMQSPNRTAILPISTFDFDRTARLLRDVFNNEDRHKTVTKTFLASLEARTMYFAQQFEGMTTLEISNAQKQWAQARVGREFLLAEWDEMARKIAHIGVIHWRVWRDICYWEEREVSSYGEPDSPGNVIEIEFQDECTTEQNLGRSIHVSFTSSDSMENLVQGEAFIQEPTAAMQNLDTKAVQRHDSGFAEELEEAEFICATHEPIIEIDQGWDTETDKSMGKAVDGSKQ